MKLTASIAILFSILSAFSGIAYLLVGFTDGQDHFGFNYQIGLAQILISVLLFSASYAFRKNGNRYTIPFVASAALYLGFMVYVLS